VIALYAGKTIKNKAFILITSCTEQYAQENMHPAFSNKSNPCSVNYKINNAVIGGF